MVYHTNWTTFQKYMLHVATFITNDYKMENVHIKLHVLLVNIINNISK